MHNRILKSNKKPAGVEFVYCLWVETIIFKMSTEGKSTKISARKDKFSSFCRVFLRADILSFIWPVVHKFGRTEDGAKKKANTPLFLSNKPHS